jgi:hypothetical protein
MRIRVTRGVVVALVTSCVIAACGGSSDNSIASKSPDEIFNAANHAIVRASSVHISGSLVSGGLPVSLDLNLASGKGGTGRMSESGLTFRIIAVGNNIYIQGTPAFWAHFGGPAVARRLAGKWLKAPGSGQFASVSALTNMQELFNRLLQSHGVLKKNGTTTVNGQKAVAVTDTTQGGTLYVAATGQPYPIEVVKRGVGGGQITFDRINQPVQLTPPANALDLSQLR